jgi:integrase
VAQYLHRREKEGSAVAGNRERACLSSACNYAMRNGWLDFNPCHGVRRNRETPSKVYVSHEALTDAIDRAPECVQDLLAVAYLTGIRQTDLRMMQPGHVAGNRLRFIESKTGKHADYEITQDAALLHRPRAGSRWRVPIHLAKGPAVVGMGPAKRYEAPEAGIPVQAASAQGADGCT